MRGILLAALAALAVCAGAGAGAAPLDRTIISLPADGVVFLPVYVAEDTGLFAQYGLAAQIVHLAGVGTTNGVISGSVDFGFSNGASITRAAAHGQKLIAIALLSDKPEWTIMLRKDVAAAAHFDPRAALAERAKILDGKRVAVDSIQSIPHAYARVIAKEGGLDPERVAVTPLEATSAVAAMKSGQIDGLVTSPPWQQILEADGSAVVVADSLKGDPPWMTPFAGGLVITRAAFCAEHAEICRKMGHLVAAAVAFVRDHPDRSLAILKRRFPNYAPGVLERAFDEVRDAAPQSVAPTVASVANSDRLNLEAGFITADQQLKNYGALVTDEYVK